jgi:hypothetical protein
MDALGSLAILGQIFSSRSDNDNKKVNNSNKKHKKIRNIYDNNIANDINVSIAKKAKKRTSDSMSPERTGIIPKGINATNSKYNNDQLDNVSVFSDDISLNACSKDNESVVSSGNINKPGFFIDKCERFMDNRKHERRFVKKVPDNDNYLSQFDLQKFDTCGNPASSNAVGNNGTNVGRMERERDLALHGGYSNFEGNNDMTYGIAEPQEFIHNNMTPNFKQKGVGNKLRTEHANNVFQQKMELFSGATNDDRPDWKHKEEQAPLFNPANAIYNTFGTPVMTDTLEGRYNASKEQRNVLPFQQIKVGPGIGLNMNQNQMGVRGAGDTYRVLPKTVDELRTADKPKIVHEGRIVAGQQGERGQVIGRTVQNRRYVKFKENSKGNLQKTFQDQIQAPKMIGEVDPRTLGGVNRGLKESVYVGAANHNIDKVTPNELREKHKQSSRQSFLQSSPTNIQLVDGLKAQMNYNTYIPNATQREQKEKYIGHANNNQTNKTYFFDVLGNVLDANARTEHFATDRTGNAVTGDYTQGQYFNPDDITDPNMRNVHAVTDRSGNAVTGNYTQSQYYDPNNVTSANMRNVHISTDRNGKAVTGNYSQGQYYDQNDVASANMRNVHISTDRNGKAVTGNYSQGQYYDQNDVTSANMRNVHISTDRNGKAVTGNYSQGQYYDQNDITSANMRNVHISTDRNGKAVTGNYTQGQYYDQNDVTSANMRNIHTATDRTGNAVTGNYVQSQYYNPDDIMSANMRNIHTETDRTGNAVTGNYNKGQMIDPNDTTKNTMRNIHEKTDRVGNAMSGEKSKGKAINFDDIAKNTMRNIHEKADRAGKAMSGEKSVGKAIDFNDIPDTTMREIHSKTDRKGKAVTGDRFTGKAIDFNDISNVTQREITGATNHVNPADHIDVRGPKSRRDVYNMNVNTIKEQLSKGRMPTLVNNDKGYNNDMTNFRFKTVTQSDRLHQVNVQIPTNDKLSFVVRNDKNPTFYVNNRLDDIFSANLQKNPYVNNMVHKAVID